MEKGKIALVLIALGALAWPLGFALGFGVPQILPVHLALIFSGVYLKRVSRDK